MSEDKETIAKMKVILAQAMKRVPDVVANGSYQMAVQYKSDYKKADKILKNSNAKANDLNWAINAMTANTIGY